MAALHHPGADLTPRPAARHAALKDEAPTVASGQGFKGQAAADSPDCAAAHAQRKAVATLQARAALAGLVLDVLHDGACVLTGDGGMRHQLPSVQAAAGMLFGIELVRAEVAALMTGHGQKGGAAC